MSSRITSKRANEQIDQLGDLVTFLSTQPDVAASYLFGSLAEGRDAPQSDIDIAILFSGQPDSEQMWKRRLALWDALEQFTDRKVDLVILNQASLLLQNQVLKRGRLFYEGDRARRSEFEVQAGKVYADLKPMRDFFGQVLLQEIKEGGLGRRRVRTPHTVA